MLFTYVHTWLKRIVSDRFGDKSVRNHDHMRVSLEIRLDCVSRETSQPENQYIHRIGAG